MLMAKGIIKQFIDVLNTKGFISELDFTEKTLHDRTMLVIVGEYFGIDGTGIDCQLFGGH